MVLALFTAHRQIRIALLCAFCEGLGGSIVAAQQVPSAVAKPNAAPTPIPLSEIASQAEFTYRSVQSIETTLSTDQVTAAVERRLPPLTNEIELRGTEMAKFLTGIVPLELLYSMEMVLEKYRDQLSSWNHDLTERSKILDSQIGQLDGLGKISSRGNRASGPGWFSLRCTGSADVCTTLPTINHCLYRPYYCLLRVSHFRKIFAYYLTLVLRPEEVQRFASTSPLRESQQRLASLDIN
jgi:hypothetical protein